MTRDEFLAQERERVTECATNTDFRTSFIRWFRGLSSIPSEAVEAARAVLREAQQNGDIGDYHAYISGNDLHLHINTLGRGLHDPKVHRLALETANAALARARAAESGQYRPLNRQDFGWYVVTLEHAFPPRERIGALRWPATSATSFLAIGEGPIGHETQVPLYHSEDSHFIEPSDVWAKRMDKKFWDSTLYAELRVADFYVPSGSLVRKAVLENILSPRERIGALRWPATSTARNCTTPKRHKQLKDEGKRPAPRPIRY